MAGEIDPKAAEDLAKSVQAIKASTEGATRAFEDQLRIITQMRDVMAQMAGNLDGMTGTAPSGLLTPDGWAQVSKSIKSTTENTSKAATVMEKLGKIMKSPVTSAAIVMAGAFTGLIQGFKNLFALGKGIGGVLSSVADTAFSVGKAIVSIPFKMLDGLIGMAQKGGDNSYAVALEEVRDQFGSLKSESSRAVLDIAHNMDKMNETGVSATSIFGNMAERVKAVNELAKGMGSTFQVFQKEIEQNGVAIMMYQRGLGYTDEQMGALGSTAMRMGKGLAEVQNDVAKQAIGMSKAFVGINAKQMSKDMGKMTADMAHFGHMSTKEMGVAAAYAQKLGVSVEKLTGIMDATSTFDQAAEGMSKLNETFGTNIDATKMMMAQTGTEKIEILRKEFAKTGKSLESMNMQERMLVKQSSGMDDAMLNAALSSKNAGVSLDKLNKQGDKNESQTLSQADAMHELADSIKKLPQSGSSSGGFLDHIIEGFSRGVQASPAFMGLMRNIQVALREATKFGVKLGRMFVDLFPGVKDVFGGLKDIFDPSKFKKLFGDILKTFDVFKSGGSGKMEDFMENIKKVFLNFFSAEQGSGQKVLGGFKKFGEAVAMIFGKISEWVINKLADVVVGITNWLKAPKGLGTDTSGLVDGIKKPFAGALTALSEKLWPALKEFASTLGDKIIEAIKASGMAKKIMAGMALVVLGPALIGTIGSVMSAGVFKKVGTSMAGGLTGAAKQASKVASVAGGAAGSIGSASDAQKVGAAGEAMTGGLPSEEAKNSISEAANSKINWQGALKFVIGLAGFYAVASKMFEAALVIVKNVDIKDIVMAGAVMVAISAMMIPAAEGMKIVSNCGNINFGKAIITLGGMAIMMRGGLALMLVAIKAIQELNPSVKDLAKVGLLFVEVGVVIGIAAVVAKIAAGAQGISKALPGLVSIGIVVLAMGATAAVMLLITAMASPSRISAVGDLMLKMSLAFAVAAGVLAAAAVIGLAANPVTAALALVGLAAIAVVITAMAAVAISLMQQLNSIPMGADIGTKSQAFADIMNAISNLAGQVTNILKGMDFGFFESEASKAKKIELVTTMIKTLMNGDDGKGGIQGIITTVIEGIKSITPDKVAAAGAISNVLKASGEMMSSMMEKVADVQNQATNWFTPDGDKVKKALDSTSAAMSTMMTGLSSFITTIVGVISGIKNPEAFAKVAPALVSILSASGNLMKEIMPSMSAFQTEVAGSVMLVSGSVKTIDTGSIDAMANSVKKILFAMRETLPGLIDSIVETTKGIDEKSVKKLPIIVNIISAIASFMTAASAVGGSSVTEVKGAKTGAIGTITKSMPTLSSLLDSLKVGMPEVINAMVDLVKKLPRGFSSSISDIKMITTGLTAVKELMTALNDPFAGVNIMAGQGNRGNTIIQRLKDLKEYLIKMNEGDGSLPKVLAVAGTLVSSAKKSMGEGLSAGVKSITEVFHGIGELMTALNDPFAGVTGINGKNRGDTVLLRLKDLENYITQMSKGEGSLPKVIAAATTLKTETIKQGTISGADFKTFSESIKTIVTSMNEIFTAVTDIQKTTFDVEKITAMTTNMGKVPGLLTGTFTGISKDYTAKAKADAKSALAAIQEMVALTQGLDTALSKLPSVSVGAKLKAYGTAAGLGGSGVYTVSSKEVLLNVTLNVTMSADEVERIIVSQSKSIIRDRINYAIDNGSGTQKTAAFIKPDVKANDTQVGSGIKMAAV